MSSAGSEHDRLLPQPYFSSAHGSVYYTPRAPNERRRRSVASPSLPTPLYQPRQRRPHSIHIVSYPPGYIPHDLRPSPPSSLKKTASKREKADKKDRRKKEKEARKAEEKARRKDRQKRRSVRSLPANGERGSSVLDKLFALLSIAPKPAPSVSASSVPQSRSRPSSFIGFARRFSRIEPIAVQAEDRPQQPAMAAVMSQPLGGVANNAPNRNSFISIRSAKNMMSSSVTEVSKPVASGSGLSCSILLAEPNVFLTGFDHDGRTRHESQSSTALLRGKLRLSVSKNVKIKSVTLKLTGKARTEWPEGIPPSKVDMFEEQVLRTQSLVFFHAMHQGIWETEYGNLCTFSLKGGGGHHNLRSSLYSNNSNASLHLTHKNRHSSTLTAKELKRLSLQSVKSRSFEKGESPLSNQVQARGYKVFYPGTYEYAFELPIDHHQLETTKLQYGSVKWELETMVERSGAFKPNLHGTKEVSIVRVPDQMSLEMTEPISISRHWEDQLHYEIMISGKSFPIGTKIPIAFKLTPLAKVQVHKLKVFVTESIEYWTNDRRVTRKDPGRKILLLEKTAGRPLEKQFEASDIRILGGGELEPEQREEARRSAAARRTMEAARANRVPEPLPEPSENILGDLDLGLEAFWGSTEIEMNVQIPTCETMARDKQLRLHPDCSWKNANVYHWIKIVMRISRLDPDDPAGKRRRHFEISIDSPFTVLNCRATQANTSLPRYSGSDRTAMNQRHHMSCGCPDAGAVDKSPSSSTGHLSLVEQESTSLNGSRVGLDRVNTSALPVAPQAAHLQTSATRVGGGSSAPGASSDPVRRVRGQEDVYRLPVPIERDRPMHLLRHPSFNPPPFDADDPPPPVPADVVTPPPNYDVIIGTPSVDGLADYFSRLADYEDPGGQIARHASGLGIQNSEDIQLTADPRAAGAAEDFFTGSSALASVGGLGQHEPPIDDDSSDSADDDPARPHRGGRVNIANPRTPGGRLVPSRSLEIERPVVRLDMSSVVRRGG
ncbi:hypothetical protein QBC46DRAFT_171558 [Diplogelasinospora grovesii]|uniref:Arrestin C-terminal-like domain-containing protein n=1 Tax=Diplogelasinospora grovesii TaxID=303347 RepID=A0AAN6S316_9PEZI|nr:hypothetical protein QBC46DRAFT_171558 [Diplogelasinospora grovesii]